MSIEPTDFRDFLAAWGETHPPKLIYRDGDDFGEWQTRFRAALDSLRGPLPQRVEPEAEVLEESDQGDHRRLTLRYHVSELHDGLAHLLLPMGVDEPRAGLLALHGHHHAGMDAIAGVDPETEEHAAYGLAAVRAGYVVLCPAWWGWAGRDGHLSRVGQRDKCNVIQMAAGMYGLNVIDLHIQDAQAALDVLSARPEVDAARLGCLGNSYGGRTAMWAALFDQRIRAVVPAGCCNTFRERSLKLGSCAVQYLPGLLRYGDVPELFALLAPRPLQLQTGAVDPLITPADRDHIQQVVERAYASSGSRQACEFVIHPGGHLLRFDLAAPFFQKYLGAA